MRRQNATAPEILAALRETNKRCDPPHTEKDLVRISRSVARYAPEAEEHALTDAGNAAWYADAYGDHVRYDRRRGLWLVWDGVIWAAGNDGALTRYAIEAAKARGRAVFAENDANPR